MGSITARTYSRTSEARVLPNIPVVEVAFHYPESRPRAITSLLASAIEWLDGATAELRRRFHHMIAVQNEKVNSMTPIARLPEELLRIILQCDVDLDDGFVNNRPVLSTVTKWLRLGHVCRLWRRVTFDMPTVWADIVFGVGERKAVDVLLSLTETALLNVSTTECLLHHDLGRKLSEIFPRAWRIAHSSLTAGDANSFVNLITSQPFPHLRTLRFAPNIGIRLANLGQHTNLRSLSLDQAIIRPPYPCILTDLDVTFDGDEWVGEQIDCEFFEAIVCVFAQNPTLRRIRLTWVTNVSLQPSQENRTRIFMPSLNEIYFRQSPFEHTFMVLDSIIAPNLEYAT